MIPSPPLTLFFFELFNTQAENGDELVRDAIDCWTQDNHLCNMRDKWVLYTNTFYWASNR